MRISAAGVLALTIATVAVSGCGGGGPSESAADNVKRQVQGKVEAMKQLAEAVEKNDQQGILGALKGLTTNALDAKANPEAAKELMDVYNARVKGKLKGDAALQAKAAVDAVERQLKK